jgi:hypothetical protein
MRAHGHTAELAQASYDTAISHSKVIVWARENNMAAHLHSQDPQLDSPEVVFPGPNLHFRQLAQYFCMELGLLVLR